MSIRFEKVSFEQYFAARKANSKTPVCEEIARAEYDNFVRLPVRATSNSAGYDFCSPIPASFSKQKVVIPTGIRVKLDSDRKLFLGLYPRSGLGFKYEMKLCNTTGIIDADYYYANNEGHIMVAVTSEREYDLKQGERFVQGIIQEYFVTDDDNATDTRTGGMGSTGK